MRNTNNYCKIHLKSFSCAWSVIYCVFVCLSLFTFIHGAHPAEHDSFPVQQCMVMWADSSWFPSSSSAVCGSHRPAEWKALFWVTLFSGGLQMNELIGAAQGQLCNTIPPTHLAWKHWWEPYQYTADDKHSPASHWQRSLKDNFGRQILVDYHKIIARTTILILRN